MLSSLSGCALKKIASSGSSLLQPLTWVSAFFRCRAKALWTGRAPWVQREYEERGGLLQQSFLLSGVDCPKAQGALGCWEVWRLPRVGGTPLAKSAGTWLLNWSRSFNPKVRLGHKLAEIPKTKNILFPQSEAEPNSSLSLIFIITLRAHNKGERSLLQGAYKEPHIPYTGVVFPPRATLQLMQGWLGSPAETGVLLRCFFQIITD